MCNTKGAGGTIRTNVNSPEDCATLCQELDGCLGSTWAYNSRKCQLSTVAEPAGSYTGGLFMQRVENDDLGIDLEECPEIGDELGPDCNEQELEVQLESCNTSLEQKSKRVEILESGIAMCTAKDGSTIQKGSYNYKIHCSKKTNFNQYKQFTTKTFDECLQACSADTGCKYAVFGLHASANCKFSGVGPATLQDISGFQILAIPTPAK